MTFAGDYLDFNGMLYPYRTLAVNEDGVAFYIIVSIKALADVLLDKDGVPFGKEEEQLDNKIAYYYDNVEMLSRSNEELLKEIFS